ncbi:MAG: nucleotide exchange factor GrpE [Deltaproteobacteria bacterium]|nr:nucleotide exchange factor GrpE [Deltaproteobacteria bacterium]
MDDINQKPDSYAEPIPFEPAAPKSETELKTAPEVKPAEVEPAMEPEVVHEETAPGETEPDGSDDFEIGITIEEMHADNIAGESDQPAVVDRIEPSEGGADEDVLGEQVPSGHGDQPYEEGERIDGPGVVKSEEQAVYAGQPVDEPPGDQLETDPLLSALGAIDEKIGRLSDLFETKINVDSHKNKVIDNLHEELQTFREGIIKKQFYSFVTDVIKVIDDIRKFKRHYDDMPPTAENMDSALNFLEGIASDIEDLFSWQGVVSFRCDECSLDTGRQRVINKIECDDPALDRMVAESIRPGYEWDGRVIRPEMVSVYMYVNNNGQEDTPADGKTD